MLNGHREKLSVTFFHFFFWFGHGDRFSFPFLHISFSFRAQSTLLFSLFTHFLFISGTEHASLFPFHTFPFHFGHGERLSFPFDSLSKPNRAQNQSSLKIHSIPQTKTAHEPSIFENNVTLNRFNNNRPFYHYSQRMHKKKAC
jgi:hypothetical protein